MTEAKKDDKPINETILTIPSLIEYLHEMDRICKLKI